MLYYVYKRLQSRMKELLREEAEVAADNNDASTHGSQQGSYILSH